MKQTVKNLLGGSWQYLRVSRQLARVFIAGFGQYPRECELYDHKGAFLAEVHFPDIFNFDALCPECGSLPRNRLLWHAVTTKDLLRADDAMLHFAPGTALRA